MSKENDKGSHRTAVGPFEKVIKESGELVDYLTLGFDVPERRKAFLARNTFCEYLDRLDSRYQELLFAQESCIEKQVKEDGPSLLDLQLRLVDKTEAYHEQGYSAISALILLLTHVLQHEYRRGMPIRSVANFLGWAKIFSDESSFKKSLCRVKESYEFRTKYAVHPQQHALRNWITWRYEHGTAVVYFLPLFREPTAEEESHLESMRERLMKAGVKINPWSDDFRPPQPHISFYVSPHVQRTHQAFVTFVSTVLNVCKLRRSPIHADPKWDRYKPRYLKEIIRQHEKVVGDDKAISISGLQFPSRVLTTYEGRKRKLDGIRKRVVEMYFKSLFPKIQGKVLFKDEYLFSEEGQEIWIPIQRQVAIDFQQIVKISQDVYLYCIWAGAVVEGTKKEWIFLANEFQEIPTGKSDAV